MWFVLQLDPCTLDVYAIVDIFNGATNKWTTASLSVARFMLSATSLPEQGLAFFAGGGDNMPSEFLTVDFSV